jgi:hypothetical protein
LSRVSYEAWGFRVGRKPGQAPKPAPRHGIAIERSSWGSPPWLVPDPTTSGPVAGVIAARRVFLHEGGRVGTRRTCSCHAEGSHLSDAARLSRIAQSDSDGVRPASGRRAYAPHPLRPGRMALLLLVDGISRVDVARTAPFVEKERSLRLADRPGRLSGGRGDRGRGRAGLLRGSLGLATRVVMIPGAGQKSRPAAAASECGTGRGSPGAPTAMSPKRLSGPRPARGARLRRSPSRPR